MKIYVMCGLPASGKSTFAKNLKGVLLSSDTLREQIYGNTNIQTNPKRIFNLLYSLADTALNNGENVIIDATNTKRKDRIKLVQHFRQYDLILFWINTPIDECIRRNSKRERKVPEDVIYKMEKTLRADPPTVGEGWDKIISI